MVRQLFRANQPPRAAGAGQPQVRLLMAATIIAATELVLSYQDQAVLDHATLGVGEGDRIGLVGRNGCGKTTFLRILAGLQSPDAGSVNKRRDLVVSYLP